MRKNHTEDSMSLEQGPGAAGRSLQQVPYLMIMAPLVSHSPPKPKLSLQEQLLNYLQSSKSTYSYSPPYPESHSSASHVSFLERAMPAVEEWRLQRPANAGLGIYKGIVIYCCSARTATLEGVKMGKKTALCWTGVLEQYPRTRRLLILYSTAWSNHQATDINKKKAGNKEI